MGIFDWLFGKKKEASKESKEVTEKRDVNQLISDLNDTNFGVRATAATALGKIGDARAVEPLIHALKDAFYAVRRDASRALGEIGDERAIEPLASCFSRHNTHFCYEDDVVADAAKTALEKIKSKKSKKLNKKKPTEEWPSIIINRPSQVVWNFFINPDNWKKWNQGVLKKVDPGWQSGATLVWGNGDKSNIIMVEPQKIVQIGSTFMKTTYQFTALDKGSTKVEVKFAPMGGALFSDGGLAHKAQISSARAKLNQCLESETVESETTKRSIEEPKELTIEPNIKKLIEKKDVEGLIEDLKHEDKDVRSDAVDALVRKGEPSVEPLIQVLKDEDEGVRGAAAETLGRIGDARAVEPLIQVVKYEDSPALWKASVALVHIGEPAVGALIQLLDDRDGQVRLDAADDLGDIGDARAVEPLIQVLKHKDVEVQKAAAKALGKIGDKRAVEPLIEAVKAESRSLRWRAADTLGKIGDERAVESLTQALKDEDSDVREAAKEALEKIKVKKS